MNALIIKKKEKKKEQARKKSKSRTFVGIKLARCMELPIVG